MFTSLCRGLFLDILSLVWYYNINRSYCLIVGDMDNVVMNIRNREIGGKMTYAALHAAIKKTLIDLFEREYLYQHRLLSDLLVLLIEKSAANPSYMSVIYSSCLDTETADDFSIVWVAKDVAHYFNDSDIFELTDDIVMDSWDSH